MLHKSLSLLAALVLAYAALRMSSLQSESVQLESLAPKDTIPNPHPLPAFFVSHGGPTFMYENDSFGNKGAWHAVKKLGSAIKTQYQPDYVVVVSAHWQLGGSNLIEIGVPAAQGAEVENELIYDFYNFPQHMYEEEFHTNNSAYVAEELRQLLSNDGFSARLTKRGLDHGVWVPLKVAFSDYNTLQPLQNGPKPPLDLPNAALIQVSLPGLDSDFDTQYKLGRALNRFRQNLIWDPIKQKYLKGLVICSGMTVHNLRDIQKAAASGEKATPYARKFHEVLRQRLAEPDRLQALKKLKTDDKTLLYQAHPTLEHFAPLVVAAGIASEKNEPLTELYSDENYSLGWGTYQVGKL